MKPWLLKVIILTFIWSLMLQRPSSSLQNLPNRIFYPVYFVTWPIFSELLLKTNTYPSFLPCSVQFSQKYNLDFAIWDFFFLWLLWTFILTAALIVPSGDRFISSTQNENLVFLSNFWLKLHKIRYRSSLEVHTNLYDTKNRPEVDKVWCNWWLKHLPCYFLSWKYLRIEHAFLRPRNFFNTEIMSFF